MNTIKAFLAFVFSLVMRGTETVAKPAKVFAHFVRQSATDTYLFSMTGLPLSVSGTTQLSKFVDMARFDYVDFFVYVGANATSVDAKVQESVNADGSSATDVSGGAITQLVAANQMAVISVKKSTLTKRYAGVLVTTVGVAVVAQSAMQYGELGNLPVAQTAAGSNSYATAQVLKI